MNPLEAAVAAYQKNPMRSPIDEANFYRLLQTEHKLSARKIAQLIFGEEAKEKNKEQLIHQRLMLLRLTPEEQELVHLGIMRVYTAVNLLRNREGRRKK
jgi:hypothetical protein